MKHTHANSITNARNGRRHTEFHLELDNQAQNWPANIQIAPGTNSNDAMYRSHKCLLIQDPYLRKFGKDKFSKWFDIERLEVDSLFSLLRKGCLRKTIDKIKPEVIFIHLGQGDMFKKIETDTIIGYTNQIIQNVLEHTSAKLCISLLIPVIGSPRQNSEIKKINEAISAIISELRKDRMYSERIYTSNNNSLSGYINYSTGAHGKCLDLSARGLSKYCIKLRDALNRCLGTLSSSTNRPRTHSVPRNDVNHD